uniref:Succinate:cytochrome c oxidoreductase subunit 4 n=1 Tax=Gastroclonium compressum TaxID=1852973 RepID=A0A173FZQ7_GASCM|nr:succinate:cytochrome c oxidoreductase subunit 4 [Coeloseira compressa]
MFNFYWFFLHWSPIFFFIGFLSDLEFCFIFFSNLFLHIRLGLESIFNDYFYIKQIILFFSILVRILLIEILTQMLSFLL